QEADGGASQNWPGIATITVADAPLTGITQTITPTEGLPFSGTVAQFTDGDPNGTTLDYTATIAWGDGTTTTGTIASSGKTFNVTGTHAYAEEGTYFPVVTINDVDAERGTPAPPPARSQAVVTSTALVSDAALTLGKTPITLSTTEGQSFPNTFPG